MPADAAPDWPLSTRRHSCAHILATAVLQLYPEAKFGVGPPTKDGFFYDIEFPEPLRAEDLSAIEKRMKKLKAQRVPFERMDVGIDDATRQMSDLNQPYKLELIDLLRTRGSTAVAVATGDTMVAGESDEAGVDSVSFYKSGPFLDLCRGPHVDHSGQIGEFKLTTIAGAYWRGDERNPQLQRIYGLCFETKQDVEHRLWQIEQAKLRDHRRVGKDLELFLLNPDVGPGLPLWLPRGTVIRDELEAFARAEEARAGYQRVVTPHITKEDLYYRSRHLPYYSEDMYAPIDIDGEKYYLKPMNCPHHHLIYGARPRSYRELPYRIAEYGQCYRYESSGALSGLLRVRGFAQNDAHIYCTYAQAKDEFVNVMHMHANYYRMFNIENFVMQLSLPDLNKLDKYVNEPEKWLAALAIIREAMDETGYPFVEAEGEAAFYGPKIDFMITSVTGIDYAISTNQLDFLAADTFDLNYIGEDGAEHPVYVIHRAPLGSHERFVAFLVEHYGGAFPVWLAPVQAMVIPIADRHIPAAEQVRQRIAGAPIMTASGGPRVEVDASAERMQKKIRTAQLQKVPYMLVIGDKEAEAGTVSVRLRSSEDLGPMSVDDVIARLADEITHRRDQAPTPPAKALDLAPAG